MSKKMKSQWTKDKDEKPKTLYGTAMEGSLPTLTHLFNSDRRNEIISNVIKPFKSANTTAYVEMEPLSTTTVKGNRQNTRNVLSKKASGMQILANSM